MRFGLFLKSFFFVTWILTFGCDALNAESAPGEIDEGYAVYYADSLNGNPTASGEPYDKTALTAAHRTLPFGTVVRVTNLVNRRSVQVRINDRGPFSARHNIIDLSRAAAERVDMIKDGIVPVRVEIVSFQDIK
jgi:rare lipoprotein A